jgi:hypothetical protein
MDSAKLVILATFLRIFVGVAALDDRVKLIHDFIKHENLPVILTPITCWSDGKMSGFL